MSVLNEKRCKNNILYIVIFCSIKWAFYTLEDCVIKNNLEIINNYKLNEHKSVVDY